MRRSAALFSLGFLMGLIIALSACSRNSQSSLNRGSESIAGPVKPEGTPIAAQTGAQGGKQRVSAMAPNREAIVDQGSLDSAVSAQAAAHAAERKIINNGEITIETDKPNEGQQKIGVIAEKHGGFVVISESKHNEAASQNVASTVVNVVVRVPAQKFQAALDEIRGVGGRILHEKSSGQDVTEEYIDLEARIRTKRALEAQFLEIMKQARKISEAMEVQSQLADVRTEIERLEGRRRYLENQSALSTINVTLHTPTPVVAAATRGFFYDLKAAFGDGAEIGSDIFLGIIRFVIVMIPVTLFILAPAWFIYKWLRKRMNWPAKAAAASAANPGE